MGLGVLSHTSRSVRPVMTAALFGMVMAVICYFTPLIDDSYIYLDYARTLPQHGSWGLTPQAFSDTATSAVQVLYLTPLYYLFLGNAHLVAAVAAGIPAVVACWAVVKTIPTKPWLAIVVAALLFMAPPVISSVGMETWWLVAVLALVWWLLHKPDTIMSYSGVGVLLAVAFMLRPDAAVFALVVLLILAVQRKGGWLAGVVFTVVGLSYTMLRWWLLGSVLPDSVWLKINQAGSWGGADILTGWAHYHSVGATAGFVLAAIVVAAGVGYLVWYYREHLVTLVKTWPGVGYLAGALVYLAAVQVAHVPPYHWYYVLPSAAMLLAASDVFRLPDNRTVSRVAAAAVIALLSWFTINWVVYTSHHQPVISTNWATEQQYSQLGEQLRDYAKGQPVRLDGEIGQLTYACGCYLEDEFSNSKHLRETTQARINQGGWKGWLWGINNTHKLHPVGPNTHRSMLLTVHKPTSGVVLFQQAVTGFDGVSRTYYLVSPM